MVHDDYKEMIPARALSALDAAEQRALNEHLDNCSECRRELAEWEATAAALAIAADPAEPSPKVREQILNEIRNDPPAAQVVPFRSTSRNIWSSFGSLGAIAAVVVFAVLLIGLAVQWREKRVLKDELARSQEFLQLVTTPGAKVTELEGVDLGTGATAKLVYDKAGHAMLMANKLPTVPQGKAYQLWFIVGKNPPMPGKTFVPNKEGNGMLKDQMPAAAIDSAIFAITMEPAQGVDAPTGPIYLRSSEIN